MTTLNMLAKENGEWFFQLIVFVVIFALIGVKQLIEWLRQRQREAEAQTKEQPVPRPAQQAAQQPAPQQRVQAGGQQVQSVEEIVQTMRQARRPVPAGAARQPIPRARGPQQPPRQSDLVDRHVVPAAVGQGVDAETARLQKHLRGQREQSAKRVGTEATPIGVAMRRDVRAVVDISLGDPDEVRRGILYSEILGPPMALRKQQGMWDM